MKLPFKDRRILEKTIFPYLISDKKYQNILFVGCHWYTKPYNAIFKDKNYWTIDPLPKRKQYGSSNHVMTKIEDAGQHFHSDFFDVIICNGVIGWGLNKIEHAEQAFNICNLLLRPNGLLIIGWNNRPGRKPYDPNDLKSLQSFSPFHFPPLGTNSFPVKSFTNHVYQFFTKNKYNS